jgi:hypothetical protein
VPLLRGAGVVGGDDDPEPVAAVAAAVLGVAVVGFADVRGPALDVAQQVTDGGLGAVPQRVVGSRGTKRGTKRGNQTLPETPTGDVTNAG